MSFGHWSAPPHPEYFDVPEGYLDAALLHLGAGDLEVAPAYLDAGQPAAVQVAPEVPQRTRRGRPPRAPSGVPTE